MYYRWTLYLSSSAAHAQFLVTKVVERGEIFHSVADRGWHFTLELTKII